MQMGDICQSVLIKSIYTSALWMWRENRGTCCYVGFPSNVGRLTLTVLLHLKQPRRRKRWGWPRLCTVMLRYSESWAVMLLYFPVGFHGYSVMWHYQGTSTVPRKYLPLNMWILSIIPFKYISYCFCLFMMWKFIWYGLNELLVKSHFVTKHHARNEAGEEMYYM